MWNLLFDINHTLFTLWGYPLSGLELWATLTGLACVVLHRYNNIWAYPVGLVNCVGFVALFYQIQLYSDFLLQGYFIVISFYGWYCWAQRDNGNQLTHPIRWLSHSTRWFKLFPVAGISTLLLGAFIDPLFSHGGHLVATLAGTSYTHTPAALPYRDAATTVLSVMAAYLMAKRYVDSWVLWSLVNIICIGNYATQGVMLLTIEYVVFLFNALLALWAWHGQTLQERHKLSWGYT